MHDLPSEDRPRERCLRLGAETLSDAELLALFVNTGVPGANALQVGQRMLREHGSLRNVSRLSAAQLKKEKALGPAKAALMAAAFEMGKRAQQQELKEKALDTPDRIYEFMAPEMQRLSQESVRVLLVNSRLRFTHQFTISLGSVNEAMAHPREILRPVIAHNAYGFILVHNHPSGDPNPSDADMRMTRRLKSAAEIFQLSFLDHLIIGMPSENRSQPYYSFRESGVV